MPRSPAPRRRVHVRRRDEPDAPTELRAEHGDSPPRKRDAAHVTMRKQLAAAMAVALWVMPAAELDATGPDPPRGSWLAGDLHVHTIYGHDTCVTPTEAWDPSSTDRAARRPCSDPYTVS